MGREKRKADSPTCTPLRKIRARFQVCKHTSLTFIVVTFYELRFYGVLGSSLSSGAARRRLRVRHEAPEDGVGDAPLETPQRLLAGFALRDLLAVVGPAPSVRPGLAYGDHVQGVVEPAVAGQREPVTHHARRRLRPPLAPYQHRRRSGPWSGNAPRCRPPLRSSRPVWDPHRRSR